MFASPVGYWYDGTKIPIGGDMPGQIRSRAAATRVASCLLLCSGTALSSVPATQVRTFHLAAPLAEVFPLFTALGERAWAKGWNPQVLSGATERGSAFVTKGHNGKEATWIVTDYRPAEGRVSYARLVRDSNIGLVDVICTQPAHGGTDVAVRYTLTPVSQAGRTFVTHFLDDRHFARMIDEWREALEAALRHSTVP